MSGRGKSAWQAGIVVRPARKNDAASLGAFFMRAWKEAGPGALGFTGATEEAMNEIASQEFLSKRLASSNTRIVIAEEGGEILGFASIRRAGDETAELSGIVVIESATGRGLGTKLVRKACQTAMKLGFERLIVQTEASNQRAIGFYKKNGFTESRKTSEKVGRVNVPIQVLDRRLE